MKNYQSIMSQIDYIVSLGDRAVEALDGAAEVTIIAKINSDDKATFDIIITCSEAVSKELESESVACSGMEPLEAQQALAGLILGAIASRAHQKVTRANAQSAVGVN